MSGGPQSFLSRWEQDFRASPIASLPARSLGWAMASYADADGTSVRPGAPLLMVAASIRETALTAGISWLRDHGWIELVREGRGSVAAEYRLTIPPDVDKQTRAGADQVDAYRAEARARKAKKRTGCPPATRGEADPVSPHETGGQEGHVPPPGAGTGPDVPPRDVSVSPRVARHVPPPHGTHQGRPGQDQGGRETRNPLAPLTLRCPEHAHIEDPPPCGRCKERRLAAERPVTDHQSPRRPEWCGACDVQTRLTETDGGMRRCPACHPLAVA